MANLTVKIDDDVLRRARMRALEEGTSVNRVVAESLREYAGESPAAVAWRAFLADARASTARSPSGRDWTREELYRR
jgi:hypothetical protein